MKAARPKALVRPDRKRCQAEWTSYHPFRCGGDLAETTRCSAAPDWIATERKPTDGRRGSMSLCQEHLEKLEELEPGRASFRRISGRA